MILVLAVFVSVLIALLRGGRLARLADLPVCYGWVLIVAVVLQYPFVFNLVGWHSILGLPVGQVLLALSTGLLVWVLWANWRLPGIKLVALGLALNVLVMACNGGWMPITPEVLARLGHRSHAAEGVVAKVWGAKNVMKPLSETTLWWLSDIFVLASPFPVPGAFSPGDVLIALGIFWLLQKALLGPKGETAVGGSDHDTCGSLSGVGNSSDR